MTPQLLWQVAGLALLAATASAPAQTQTAREKPFACQRVDLALEFECVPMRPFLGAQAGMSAKDAFAGLCAQASDAYWSVHATGKAVPTPLTQGLSCDRWPLFASSKIWTLRVNGYPCVHTRFIILRVDDGKIWNYAVWCHQLADDSLLVKEIPRPF